MNGKIITAVLAMAAVAWSAGPAQAQRGRTDRQTDKNTMRTLGIGLGAVALDQLLKGRAGDALLAGAAAAYAGKKYEDARRAQNEESRWGRRGSGPSGRDNAWDRDGRRDSGWDRRDNDRDRRDHCDDDRRHDRDRRDRDDDWRGPGDWRSDRPSNRRDLTGPSCRHGLRECDTCRHGEPVRGRQTARRR